MPTTFSTPFKRRQRQIFALAWPMMVSNLSIPLLGIVDTAILGHLANPVYLAAVAIGSSILTYLFWAFGFLRMGSTALVAQAFGKEQVGECYLLLWRSCLLGGGIALALILMHPFLFALILKLMAPPADVLALALNYCSIRIWSAPAALINFAIVGWFIGLQNTRAPLVILVTTNGANIGLDWLLIVHFDYASSGAALASAIADYVGLFTALLLVRKKIRQLAAQHAWASLFNLSAYKKLLLVNQHLFVRTALLLFVITFFVAQGGHLGENYLAANAILLQLIALTSYGLDGFAHAAEALVGKTSGQGNIPEVRKICLHTFSLALLTALFFTLVFSVFKQGIIHGFTEIQSVHHVLSEHYFWIILLPLISVWGYQLDGIFIGLNRSIDMQNSMMLATGLIFFPSWWLTQALGNHGLWFSFCLFNACRGGTLLVLLARYLQVETK